MCPWDSNPRPSAEKAGAQRLAESRKSLDSQALYRDSSDWQGIGFHARCRTLLGYRWELTGMNGQEPNPVAQHDNGEPERACSVRSVLESRGSCRPQLHSPAARPRVRTLSTKLQSGKTEWRIPEKTNLPFTPNPMEEARPGIPTRGQRSSTSRLTSGGPAGAGRSPRPRSDSVRSPPSLDPTPPLTKVSGPAARRPLEAMPQR